MKRWTIVAIAVALGACSKGERNELSRSTSDTAAVDSVTAMASDSMPSDSMSARAIPADSSSMKKTVATGAKPARAVPDTKSTAPAYTDTRKDAGLTGAEAMTGVRAAPVTHELTTDQASSSKPRSTRPAVTPVRRMARWVAGPSGPSAARSRNTNSTATIPTGSIESSGSILDISAG